MVEYAIAFPDINPSSPIRIFLPKKLVMNFKEDKTRIDLSIGMGAVQLKYLADSDKEEVKEVMQLWGNTYVCILRDDDLEMEANLLPNYLVTQTDQKKKILQWECKSASVQDVESNKEFDIYYSEEIGSNNINWHSPYESIDGLLMEYTFEHMDLKMRLTAKEVKQIPIDNEVFELEKGYKVISKDEFDNKLKELMQTVGM